MIVHFIKKSTKIQKKWGKKDLKNQDKWEKKKMDEHQK